MNKKRILCLFMSLVLAVFVLTACSSEKSEESSPSSENSLASESSEESAAEPSENSSEESIAEISTGEDFYDKTIPAVDDPTPDADGTWHEGIYVYNNNAYEMFYGGESAAKNYAETISNLKNALGDNVTVYNVVVPTHCEVGLPDRFSDLYYSQREYLDNIFSNYTADIIAVDPYYALMHHRNEYLYFSTDHHWTVDAAYLAYQVFAQQAGITVLTEDDMEKKSIEGFTGTLASTAGLTHTDTVYYYTFPYCNIITTQYDKNAENPVVSMLFHEYASGVNAYGVFLGGDFPLIVTTNEQGNGQKVAVVKESYGNAFAPFISATYSETHIIDSRYFNVNLKTYLEENDIDTIIFINNTMASATGVRCDELNAMVE